MKPVLVFNTANDAYHLALALRDKGVEADLILQAPDFGMSYPFWEEMEEYINPYLYRREPQLAIDTLRKWGAPPWIKVWIKKGRVSTLPSLYKLARGYDILHLLPSSPVFFIHDRRPKIIHEVGWIRRFPYESKITSKVVRKAYANADCIVMTNPDTYDILNKMPHRDHKFIPFCIPTDVYTPTNDPHNDPAVFLQPARQIWSGKRNDKLIHAFALFIKDGGEAILKLGEWGKDLERAKDLIHRLGIDDKVEWFGPVSKPHLKELMRQSTAVFDNFNRGSGGTTLFEAMSLEVPVVIYLNHWNKTCFGKMPPILNARTIPEIKAMMHYITEDDGVREPLGRAERTFVKKHMSPPVVADSLIKLYEEYL